MERDQISKAIGYWKKALADYKEAKRNGGANPEYIAKLEQMIAQLEQELKAIDTPTEKAPTEKAGAEAYRAREREQLQTTDDAGSINTGAGNRYTQHGKGRGFKVVVPAAYLAEAPGWALKNLEYADKMIASGKMDEGFMKRLRGSGSKYERQLAQYIDDFLASNKKAVVDAAYDQHTKDVTGEAPSADAPSAETPSAEAPSAETPSAEAPSAETPSAETPPPPEGYVIIGADVHGNPIAESKRTQGQTSIPGREHQYQLFDRRKGKWNGYQSDSSPVGKNTGHGSVEDIVPPKNYEIVGHNSIGSPVAKRVMRDPETGKDVPMYKEYNASTQRWGAAQANNPSVKRLASTASGANLSEPSTKGPGAMARTRTVFGADDDDDPLLGSNAMYDAVVKESGPLAAFGYGFNRLIEAPARAKARRKAGVKTKVFDR